MASDDLPGCIEEIVSQSKKEKGQAYTYRAGRQDVVSKRFMGAKFDWMRGTGQVGGHMVFTVRRLEELPPAGVAAVNRHTSAFVCNGA